MDQIPWQSLADKLVATQPKNSRGTYQAHYGWATGVSYEARSAKQTLADYGCVCPSELSGTRDELVVGLFVIMSEIARRMKVDFADMENMKAKIKTNRKAYHPDTGATFEERMLRFAKSIHPDNVFEGLTVALLPFDGDHRVLEHCDRHNDSVYTRSVVVANTLPSGGLHANPFKVCLIGYMRKSNSDFCLRRRAAMQVGRELLAYQNALPASRAYNASPEDRFRGIGMEGVSIARQETDGKVVMAQLLSKAAMDKEITFLSPMVHAVFELSHQVDMTLREGIQLCLLTGFVSNMLVMPSLIRTTVLQRWGSRFEVPGGVLGILVDCMVESVGGVSRGPHPRCQVSFQMAELTDHAIAKATEFLVKLCSESRNHGHLKEKGLDDHFSKYCKLVMNGLRVAGISGCGPLLVQHLIKVLVMCRFLEPVGMLRCAVTIGLCKTCLDGAAYVNGRATGSKMDRLAILQDMNVAYLREATQTDISRSAVENMRCELYRNPERMDPYGPGQPFIELDRSEVMDTLLLHCPTLDSHGGVIGTTTCEFNGPKLAPPGGKIYPVPCGAKVKTGTGVKNADMVCSWRYLTLESADFAESGDWEELKNCFLWSVLGNVQESYRLIETIPGFEAAWSTAAHRDRSKTSGGKTSRKVKEIASRESPRLGATTNNLKRPPPPSLKTTPETSFQKRRRPPGGNTSFSFVAMGDVAMGDVAMGGGFPSQTSAVVVPASDSSIGSFSCDSEIGSVQVRPLRGIMRRMPRNTRGVTKAPMAPIPCLVVSSVAGGGDATRRQPFQWDDSASLITWEKATLSGHCFPRPPTTGDATSQKKGSWRLGSFPHVRCYPGRECWSHFLHAGYRGLANTGDIMRFPESSDTAMSSFLDMASNALKSLGGLRVADEVSNENMATTTRRVKERPGESYSSVLRIGNTVAYDFNTVSTCGICDLIAERLGGSKAHNDSDASWVWVFASPRASVDYVCICLVVTAGSSSFFQKLARQAKKRWSKRMQQRDVRKKSPKKAPASSREDAMVPGATTLFVDRISNKVSTIAIVGCFRAGEENLLDFCYVVLDTDGLSKKTAARGARRVDAGEALFFAPKAPGLQSAVI